VDGLQSKSIDEALLNRSVQAVTRCVQQYGHQLNLFVSISY